MPTIYQRTRRAMVGTLRFAHPTPAFPEDDSRASLAARPHIQHVAVAGAEVVDPAQPGAGIGA